MEYRSTLLSTTAVDHNAFQESKIEFEENNDNNNLQKLSRSLLTFIKMVKYTFFIIRTHLAAFLIAFGEQNYIQQISVFQRTFSRSLPHGW